jgi:MoxR-like ATPase
MAAIRGRDYVIPDDIKEIAEQVLAHRVIVQPAAKLHGLTSNMIILEIMDSIAVS